MIRGTRIPVETVLRKLGADMTLDAILADHPRLTRDDVLATQQQQDFSKAPTGSA